MTGDAFRMCPRPMCPRTKSLGFSVHRTMHPLKDRNTEYTELLPLLFGVHSVMRVKSAWLVRVGGARQPPLITFTLTSKVAVYAPAEWADTLTLFHLYQYMYSVDGTLERRVP
jgi:hypothetical protein